MRPSAQPDDFDPCVREPHAFRGVSVAVGRGPGTCSRMDAPLLSAAGFAELVGVDPSHVRRLCREGRLSHYRVGATYRIDRDVALGELLVDAVPQRARPASAPVAAEPRSPRSAGRSARTLDRRRLKEELFA